MARQGVDRDLVMRTAAEIVDRDGADQLTMTALASALGVRTPSLYSHVESVDAVLSGVQVLTMRQIGDELARSTMGRSGPDGYRAMATAMRSFAHRHPGSYDLAMREPIDRDAVLVASGVAGDAFSAVIRSFGIERIPASLVVTCVSILHGVLAIERAQLFRPGRDAEMDVAFDTAVELVIGHLQQQAAAST